MGLTKFGGLTIVALLLVRVPCTAGTTVPLIEAARNCDRAALRTLLRQHVNVNAAEADGATAVYWSAQLDDIETLRLLIDAGADAKAANRYGVTPLSIAATNGNAGIVEMLLKAGADPNTALPGGETTLMTAARTGELDAVKVLLSGGADVNAKETWRGQTALMWAAAEGYSDVVQALVSRGANIDARSKDGFTALLFAIREGKIAAVRRLLDAGANVNDTLAASGADDGPSALVVAVANAHYELASLLLDRGADPNAAGQGWTALHEITWVRKAGTASNNPAPAGSGNMDALELVRRLAAHGADVNARMTKKAGVDSLGYTSLNMRGATPFLMAARTADAELMRLLIELGADALMPNADGTTPLMVAAGVGTAMPGEDPGTESEVLEAVKIAWTHRGDVNAVDKNGDTAMHGAAYKGMASAVFFLAEKKANIEIWNRKDKKGWTPLNIAEGVVRGMDIVGSPGAAAAIREVMNNAGAVQGGQVQLGR